MINVGLIAPWMALVLLTRTWLDYLESQYSSTAHKMLHIAIILLATFLLGISVIAYARTRRRKLLILNGALALFALKEYIIFSSVVFYLNSDIIIPHVGAPITHVLNFGILLLILLGCFTS